MDELLEQLDMMEEEGFEASRHLIDALDNWDTEAEDYWEREMDRIFFNMRNREKAIVELARRDRGRRSSVSQK